MSAQGEEGSQSWTLSVLLFCEFCLTQLEWGTWVVVGMGVRAAPVEESMFSGCCQQLPRPGLCKLSGPWREGRDLPWRPDRASLG